MKRLQYFLSMVTFGMSVGACFKMPIRSKGSVSVRAGSVNPLIATQVSDVKSVASVDPSSKSAQMITAPASGALSGASVIVPPGALNIGSDFVIEQASDFSQTSLFNEMGFEGDDIVESVGSGLIIRPSESVTLSQPLVINLPIPVGTSLKLQSNQNITVFYKQYVGDSLMSGLISSQDITVNADNSCSFKGYFGAYWVALVSTPITEAKSVKTQEPIVNAQNVSVIDTKGVVAESTILIKAAMPEVSWLDVNISLDTLERSVALNSKVADNVRVSACKADFFTSTTALSGITIDVSNIESAVMRIAKTEAHTLYGRFRCLDEQGRSTRSPWSKAIQVPAFELPALTVASLNPIIAKQGDVVTINGENFRTGIKLAYLGRELTNVSIKSDQVLTVVIDDAPRRGVGKLYLTQSGIERSLNLAYAGTSSDFPLMTVEASEVCQGQKFYNANGDLLEGTKVCAAASVPACTSDGQINCIASSSYASAATSGLSAKVVSGQTVAGIVGTASGESHSNCSVDGGTGCVATATYAAALTTGLGPKVIAGNTVAGIAGSAIGESHSNCASNGATGCVTTSTYRSADWTNITASNIRSGISLAGVMGQYPSATFPLDGSTPTSDLTNPTLYAQLKSPTSFEWFDSTGAVFIASGDPDIAAANIVSSVDIFGTTGSVGNCTSDGQTGCVTTSAFKSVDISSLSPWDVRVGKYAGGVNGQLRTSCQNRINSVVFNIDGTVSNSAGTSGITMDPWDTIDNYNNNLDSLPTSIISGFGSESVCDASTNIWMDMTSDGTCDSSADDCVFYDRITQSYWSESNPVSAAAPSITGMPWSNAINQCNSLTFGGFTDWRLPTQNELAQGTLHGLRDIGYKGGTAGTVMNNSFFIPNVDDAYFWSATTGSAATTSAWHYLSDGTANTALKSSTITSAYNHTHVCIRP